jgi:GT2 family glycosyltransferase
VDVVIVSYNSAHELRDAVEPLVHASDVTVIVVDNASQDGSLGRVADLRVTTFRNTTNDGFAAGCNRGWRAGSAPYVCFLNPDAILDEPSLARMVAILDEEPLLAAAAPRIEEADGTLVHSLRRFPRVLSTYSRALFLHRLFPRASWTDDVVRDPAAYDHACSPDWVSGACLVARREALEQIGGWDDGFFLYGEDVDLCRRLRNAGWDIRFEPAAVARHLGGRSAPRSALLPVLARSRLRYARKHGTAASALAVRGGVALGAATHVLASRGGRPARRGHLAALAVAIGLASHTAGRR